MAKLKANKPLVATNRGIEKRKKINKILKVLTKYPEGAAPKLIAFRAGLNVNTVKGLIKNIEEIEQVGNLRGIYRLVAETGVVPIFAFNFHNLLLTNHVPNYTEKTFNKTLSCSLVNFQFTIGAKSKQASLRISNSIVNGTNYPLNISSITLAFALFKELIHRYAGEEITMKDVIVKSIEFNKDFSNLKLEGINCITLENLIEQFKIYNKKQGVRIEHKLKVPLTATALIKLLGINLRGN